MTTSSVPASPIVPTRSMASQARRLLISIVSLVLIGLAAAAGVSLFSIDLWLHDRNSALWHVVVDVLVGVGLTLLMAWLARRGIRQLEAIEQAALRSRERAQMLSELAADFAYVVRITPEGHQTIEWATDSFNMLTGYRESIPTDMAQLAALVHPDDLPRFSERERALLRGETYACEFRVRTQNGEWLWARDRARGLWNDDHSRVIAIYGAAQDITSRKRSEEVLTRYARGMTALYQTSLEINSQPDVATLLTAIVQRAIELLSMTMGGLYLVNEGDQTLVLVTSEPAELAGTMLQPGEGIAGRVAQSGSPLVVADYAHWPDHIQVFNRIKIGRVLGVPLKLRGNVIGVLMVEDAEPGTFSDEDLRLVNLFADQAVIAIENRRLLEQLRSELLERRRVEVALRDSETRYRTLIENQGEGICYVSENEDVIFANPAANEIFGLTEGSLVSHNLKEFMRPEEFAAIRRETEVRRMGQTSTYESKIVRGDGEARTLLVTARPRFDEAGAFLGTFGIFRDITDLKQAEDALRRAAERRLILYRASQEISASLDLEQLCAAIHRAVAQVMPCEDLVIDLYAEERNEIVSLYLVERGRRLTALPYLADHGLAGYLVQHGQSLLLNSPEEIERSGIQQEPYGDLPTVSILAVPFRFKDKIRGMLSAQSYHVNAYTTDDQELLEILAAHAINAIENARLFEAERQRREEVEAIYRASLELTTSLEISQVLPAFLRATLRLVPAKYLQIYLYDRQCLRFGAAMDDTGRQLTSPIHEPRPNGILYTVARSGEPLVIEDSRQSPMYVNLPPDWQVAACVAMPLKIESTVVGVMGVEYPAARHIDEAERRILSLLAAQAAIAIQNAQLHEQVKRHADELKKRVAERTAELEHERQHLQAILDSAGEGIQIMNPEWRIEYINPATERITGFSAQEVVGNVTRWWAEPAPEASAVAHMKRQVTQGQAWQGEIINRRKDGTPYDSAVTITPLKDQTDRVTGYVAVHRDITRLKELERLKDQFVSRIGHELRTPIANVKLYAELLERGKPEKQHDYLQTLHHEIDRLTRLIDGFLEISELDAGRTPLSLSIVNVNQLLFDLVRDRQALVEARDLDLALNLDPLFNSAMITTDRALIARALSNIVDNALHYAPHGADVTVSTNPRVETDQTWAVISVHNTGPGLSPGEMPRLFERFYRGEAARDYRVPGAGLGLAIAQAIIQRLGGRLMMESQPDQGVTFAVWLKLTSS